MSWQEPIAFLIVAAAAVYIVWKFFWAGRRPRRKRGPDVPLARLKRAPRAADRKRE